MFVRAPAPSDNRFEPLPAATTRPLILGLALSALSAVPGQPPAAAAGARTEIELGVEELQLENGMTILLVERPSSPDVAAGWVVGSGSADDPAAHRGLAHVVEHLMFKGSRTIATRDYATEMRLIREIDELRGILDELEQRGKQRSRKAGELDNRLTALEEQRQRLLRPGELALHYSEAGASALNAFTFEDFSMYFVRVPAGKLELWFWLESDRLREPVFREFHKEKGIIREEVEQRIGSTPTGRSDQALRETFWGDSSYGWRSLGRIDDLDRLRQADAESFFQRHYGAANLTAVIVGRFDRSRAKELARRYFAPLAGPAPPPRATTTESRSSKRSFETGCDCPTQARVLYPSVPFRHSDSYALQVLAGVLNGRTGRLYRSLVLDQKIAFAASASQISYRDAGYFEFSAETKGAATPEDLVAAWDRELDRLLSTQITDQELRKVKNQVIAHSLRGLRRPTDLARQLLIYAGLGGWRQIEDWPRRIDEVSASQARKIGATLLRPDNRLVAHYRGTGDTASTVEEPD